MLAVLYETYSYVNMSFDMFFWLYLIPMFICLIWYVYVTVKNYNHFANKSRPVELSYGDAFQQIFGPVPDTVGTILLRIALSICPLVNLLVTIFEVGPRVYDWVEKRVVTMLNHPITPRR